MNKYKVFPTRVGMVRSNSSPVLSSICFPHTRGDGPASKHCMTA